MGDITKAPVWRFQMGNVTGTQLEKAFSHIYRDVLARMDMRFAQWDGAGGLVANDDGTVTVKSGAGIDGRTGSSLPTMVSRITNGGKALNQTFLPTVSVTNRLSAQNTDPLTSTSDASTSTITVAAHVVTYGAGTISYSGGTISGLSTDTAYFVYADDEDLAGGAVAYSATTSATTVVANNNRYYVGSIRTAKNAATANVSNATQANPCVITTSAAHTYTTGDTVSFSGVGGMVNLNTGTYTITVLSSTTFSLNGTDSTAFPAYTTGGTVTRTNTSSSGSGGSGGSGGGWSWGDAIP